MGRTSLCTALNSPKTLSAIDRVTCDDDFKTVLSNCAFQVNPSEDKQTVDKHILDMVATVDKASLSSLSSASALKVPAVSKQRKKETKDCDIQLHVDLLGPCEKVKAANSSLHSVKVPSQHTFVVSVDIPTKSEFLKSLDDNSHDDNSTGEFNPLNKEEGLPHHLIH